MSSRSFPNPQSPTPKSQDVRLARGLLALVLLLGFGLRVYRLGEQSFWFDEGFSVSEVILPLGQMLGILVQGDIHPPLYYLLLWGWVRLAGPGEFAVRVLSVVIGTLLIATTCRLGYELDRPGDVAPANAAPTGTGHPQGGAPTVGAAPCGRPRPPWPPWPPQRASLVVPVGTGLVAVSPFLVYYARDARNYSLLALTGVIASLGLWRALHPVRGRPCRGCWIAYGIALGALIYAHYFGVFVWAAHVIYLGLGARAHRRQLLPALGAMLLGLLLFIPWSLGALRQWLRIWQFPDFWAGELSLQSFVDRTFTTVAVGWSGSPAVAVGAIAALFAVAIVAAVWRGVASGQRQDVFLAVAVVVPMTCLYALTARNPKFTERYLIAAVPAFYLLVARALDLLSALGGLAAKRWPSLPLNLAANALAATLAMTTLGASLLEIRQVYDGAAYAKEDFRAVAAYIREREQPGDAIALILDSHQTFELYYGGRAPVHGIGARDDIAALSGLLNQAIVGNQRIWVVLWHEDWADPTGFFRDSLNTTFPRLPVDRSFHGLGLALYDVSRQHRFAPTLEPERSYPINFDDTLHFLGFDPWPERLPAGADLPLLFYWQAPRKLDQDYVVSVRLRDERHVWSRVDERPAADTYPTYSWRVGQIVRDRATLPIPAGTPPGLYRLEVVVYPRGTRRDLSVRDEHGRAMGTAATIGAVRIERSERLPDSATVALATRSGHRFGGIVELLGATVETPSLRRGETGRLVLAWRALVVPTVDYRTRLTVIDAGGTRHVVGEGPPADGRSPTSTWRAGEVTLDRHRVPIGPRTAPGRAKLEIEVLEPDGDRGRHLGSALVGELEVLDRSVSFEPPRGIPTTAQYQVGEVGQLIAYRLDANLVRPGGELRVTLHWRADGPSDVPYTVFTHLIQIDDETGFVWAQDDAPPQRGEAPTTSWTAGEYLADDYVLRLKPDLPAGAYAVEIGMYDPVTGTRLPILDGDGALVGDRTILGQVTVGP